MKAGQRGVGAGCRPSGRAVWRRLLVIVIVQDFVIRVGDVLAASLAVGLEEVDIDGSAAILHLSDQRMQGRGVSSQSVGLQIRPDVFWSSTDQCSTMHQPVDVGRLPRSFLGLREDHSGRSFPADTRAASGSLPPVETLLSNQKSGRITPVLSK